MKLEDISKRRPHLERDSIYARYLGKKLIYPFVFNGEVMIPAYRNLTVYLINLLDEYGITLNDVPTTSDKPVFPDEDKKQIKRDLSTAEIRSYPPNYLRAEEAACYIGVGDRLLRTLVAERSIPFVRIRRRIIFRRVDLDRWMESHQEGVAL